VFVPPSVTAKVHNGDVKLEGPDTWGYQPDAAERAVRYLTGVVSVYNSININPEASAVQVKEQV
jgi:osmotically-inducible protein OsmY